MDVIARQRRTFPYNTLRLLLFALAYLIACSYGFYFRQTAAAPLWFPESVLLCTLLLTPRKSWWIYLAIAVPIRFIPTPHPDVPLWFRFATSANDLTKAALAAYLLRRLSNDSTRLATMRQFATFLGVAVLFVPALSAVAGAFTRQLLGYGLWVSFYQWFLGNALANLVLTPALLYWCSGHVRIVRPTTPEFWIWVAGFLISLQLALRLTYTYSPIAFCIPVPSLIWAAIRFRPIGAATALSVIALLATVRITETGNLFFAGLGSRDLLFFQLFLFVISVPVLCVAVLIEERGSVETNLRETQRELEKLAGRLINAQENERRRIARELHDDTCQRLAILSIELEGIIQTSSPSRMHANREHSEPENLDDLQRAVQHCQEIASSVHTLSHQLHSSTLEMLGLAPAVLGVCQEFSQQYDITVSCATVDLPDSLPREVSLCLFRVVQEALRNAVKYSGGNCIEVSLRGMPDTLALKIRDSGMGFDVEAAAAKGGMGLVSMKERVRLVRGSIKIESQPNGGTQIAVTIPIGRHVEGGTPQ